MASRTLRLFITADGEPAVRVFNEVGAASKRSADVVEESSVKSQAALDDVHKSGTRLLGGLGSLAGMIGLGGVAFGLKDVIQAGISWQSQQAQLQNALRRTGQYSASNMKQVMDAAESLSTHGGFVGPQELQSISQFERITGSVTKAIHLNVLATDLARANVGTYTTDQRMLGQVLTGNVGRLQRYLGIIQPVKTAEFALGQAHKFDLLQLELRAKAMGTAGSLYLKEQEILHGLTPQMVQHAQKIDRIATSTMVLSLIQQKYGRSTQVFSNSTAGSINNLRNSWDILAKNIGQRLLPILSTVLKFLASHTKAVEIVAFAVGALTLAWGLNMIATTAIVGEWSAASIAAGAFTGALALIRGGIMAVNYSAILLEISATAMWAAVTLGATLAITAIILIATHFSTFKAVVMDVWNWIKKNWQLLLPILMGPLAPVVIATELIANNLKTIEGLAKAVGGFFSGIFGGGSSNSHAFRNIGGYRGHAGDTSIVHRSQVQNVSVNRLNSVVPAGTLAGGHAGIHELHVRMPVQLRIGNGRILSQEVVHFAARQSALNGSYVSG